MAISKNDIKITRSYFKNLISDINKGFIRRKKSKFLLFGFGISKKDMIKAEELIKNNP